MAAGYVWLQTAASADSVHAGTTRGIRYGWQASGGINNFIIDNTNNNTTTTLTTTSHNHTTNNEQQ